MRFLLAFLLLSSCKPTVSKVVFQTDLGQLCVRISNNLPGDVEAQLDQLLHGAQDSLAIGQVLHDGFIQLNAQAADVKYSAGKAQVPVSGTFLLSGGHFYIVQGREQTDASLDKWEQTTGRKITQPFRELYKKKGGALQFEGRCYVLGALASGQEVLDRIAALPSASDGSPLRHVSVRIVPSR